MSSSSLSEAERVVNRLRNSDPGKFDEFVKARITQIVDLAVLEDFLGQEQVSTSSKRGSITSGWLRERRKERTKRKSHKESVTEIDVIGSELTCESVHKVRLLIDYLHQGHCIEEEGIFRKSGNALRQRKLVDAFNSGPECLRTQLCEDVISPHDVAGLLKLYLRELPEPLLMSRPNVVYKKLAELFSCPMKMQECLQLLLQLLPHDNHVLLQSLLDLLQSVIQHPSNKMTSSSLGTLFAPHLFSCRPVDAEAMKMQAESGDMATVMAFMVENAHRIFQIPKPLVSDIENYWKELEQGGVTSTEDMDCSSRSTGSKAAHSVRFSCNMTEEVEPEDFQAVELAKLHAKIAAMPEDSKQRKKLIKRITQANTPNPKHKRSRSVGSALKKLVGINHSYRGNSSQQHSPPPSFRRLKHSQSDQGRGTLSDSPSACDLTSSFEGHSPPWTPVQTLFQDEIKCKQEETPTKEITHDPSLVHVVEHRNSRTEKDAHSEKAKIIVLKSPIKGASHNNSTRSVVTTIDFLSPRCNSSSLETFRRRHRTELHPLSSSSHKPPARGSGKPLKPLLIDENNANKMAATSASMATAIATPYSNRLVKTAVKRRVPTSTMVTVPTGAASKKSPPSSRSHFSTPARSLVPESFRIAMASPMQQSMEGSPLGRSLESAPHSIKKTIATPRSRKPMVM